MINRHRASKAIILAAGRGERLRPLTSEVPKPLITVNGRTMIESAIAALHANDIREIHVVVGWLNERFRWLEGAYPGLELIVNPYYATSNNISSLYVARKHLEDCLVMDGDQVIRDSAVLDPYFACSGYNVAWCEGETSEWLLDVEDGLIKSCSRDGGCNGFQLYSISRWTKEDGRRLARHVAIEFESGNTDIYWDDVPLFCYPHEYHLGVRIMRKDAVIEIDTVRELASLDATYAARLASGGRA